MTLSAYFQKKQSKPKYLIGDRVRGWWNNIPFSGTVAIESKNNETQTPMVSVFLDLPIKYKNTVYNLIKVRHKDINKNGKLL